MANPTDGTWDGERFIDVSAPGADQIYCKVSISTNGIIPVDPPEPTIEVHDAFNRNLDQTIGPDQGQFQLFANEGELKIVKVRFRGHNQYGYGPSSPVYQYTLDLRSQDQPEERFPEPATAMPQSGLWSSPEHFIDVSAPGAEQIYCKVSITRNGDTPEDPPEPTIEVHDAFNRNLDQTIGPDQGQFQIFANEGEIKRVKVRFRGHNQYGYGPSSPVYYYIIDRTGTPAVTPPSAVTVSPTTGNWDDSPQFINVSSPGAERIYCTVRTTDDGSNSDEPPEPTVEVHDAFNQNMDQFIGPSGQFEVWAEPGDYKVVKVRFRAHNSNGYGPTTDTYTYRIDRTQEVAPDTDKPDLIVRDLYLNHDEDSEDRITRFALGEDIRINTRVKNIGGADVDQEVKIEYYLSPGENITPSTWEYIGKDFLDEDDLTVRSSGYDDYDYSSDDPLPQTPRIYNITVVADTLGDIDEENENNNMFDPPLVFEIYDPNAQQPGPGTGPTTNNIDSALIIDSSGSMGQNDPTQNRLEAARFFIDRADPGDHICVVDFDGSAAVNPAMGTLRDAGSNRGILKDAVNLIDSSGGTNIGEGLRIGYQELSRSPTGNQKIAILLTDGKDSGGNNNREALDYQAQGWRVFTIGLGSGADEERLIEIAQTTGGDYFAVTTEQAAQNAITEIYKRISRTVNQTELTIHQELFMVSEGEIVERFFDVLPGTQSLAVDRIIPGSDVEMILVKPDGTVIDRQTQSADVYHALGATYEIYKVENPMPGRWIMRLRGIETLPGGEPTNVSIAVDHPEKELYLEGIFNMNVPEGDTAILRGANPLNIDDDIVSYRWVLVSKSSDRLPDPILSDPYSANPTFKIPEVGQGNGTYVYHCITTDAQGFETTEVYTVNAVNDGPGDDGEISVSSSSCFLDALF